MKIHCSGHVLPVQINSMYDRNLNFRFTRECRLEGESSEAQTTYFNMNGVYNNLFSRFNNVSIDSFPQNHEQIHTNVTFNEDGNPDSISITCSLGTDDSYDSELTNYVLNANIEHENGVISLKDINFYEFDPITERSHCLYHGDCFKFAITPESQAPVEFGASSHEFFDPRIEKLAQLISSHTYLIVMTLNDTFEGLEEGIRDSFPAIEN